MKYENYGLIQENWNRFVVREQSARALLESLTPEKINEILDENKRTYFDTVGQPRGPIEKLDAAVGKFIDKIKTKVLRGAGIVAVGDILVDLPQTGVDIDVFTTSPIGVGIITLAIMNQFKITKDQAVKAAQTAAQTARDKGPDAARQAAAATADAARVAGQKTIEYVDRVSKDSRASPGMKKFFRNVAAILKPEDLENEEQVQQSIKQIVDKTMGGIQSNPDDDIVIEPEYEVDGEPEPT